MGWDGRVFLSRFLWGKHCLLYFQLSLWVDTICGKMCTEVANSRWLTLGTSTYAVAVLAERNLSGTQASFWRPRGSSQITPWILWFMCAGEYMQTKCCWAYLLWWRWQYRKDFLKSVCVEEVLKQLLLVWKKKYVHLGCMDKQLVLSREELGNLELFAESWVRLDVGGQTSWFPSRGILCSCFSLVNSQEIVVLAGGKATVERSMCYGSEERVMLIYLSPLLIAVPVNRTKCLFILGFLRDICTLHDPVFDERGVTQLLWNEIFAQGRMLIYLKSLNQLWLCSVRDF